MQTDVQQAFLQYRYKAETSAGALCIFPMRENDLPATTELLTQSFAESMGYFNVYRHVHIQPCILQLHLQHISLTQAGMCTCLTP